MASLVDLRCAACNTVFEAWAKLEGSANPPCPQCDHAVTNRIIGAPRLLYCHMAADGSASSDALTTSVDKWDKMRKQKMKIESRNFERHGTYS